MALVPRRPDRYKATPKLARELARTGQVSLTDGPYRATVLSAGPSYFEAYTDSQPFVYGRPSSTLQGALDNLDAAVRDAQRNGARTGTDGVDREQNPER
jgi:hypothetical protein